MNEELHGFIYNQVRRDLRSWSFDPVEFRDSLQKMETLMLSENRHSKMLLYVNVNRHGTVTFSTAQFKNITYDQISLIPRLPGCRSTRLVSMMKLIHMTSILHRLPPVRFYVYTSDTYCYEHRELPLFVLAKPSNREGILFPDNSFHEEEGTWEHQLKLVHQHHCPLNQKIPVVFFKGLRSGKEARNNDPSVKQKWGTRCVFETYAENHKFLQVNIGGSHEPMHEWTKYKYLLNLPGAQPWSYRFKYLLAMRSVVIDIVVQQQYDRNPMDYNERWDNIFDAFFRPDHDYVQVIFRWIKGDSLHNEQEHARVLQKVHAIFAYFENNKAAYQKMVQSSTTRLKQISQEAVYHSMSVVINEYAQAIRSHRRQ